MDLLDPWLTTAPPSEMIGNGKRREEIRTAEYEVRHHISSIFIIAQITITVPRTN